eukprot:EG_transcript_33219
MADFVPAIVIANGKARVGTLVQIERDGDLLKGKVVEFDAGSKTVTVALDGGEEVAVEAGQVQRQQPQAGPPQPPAAVATAKPTAPAQPTVVVPARTPPTQAECAKCHGKGERKAVLGLAGKLKACKACDGTGHTA